MNDDLFDEADLVVAEQLPLASDVAEEVHRAREYAAAAHADNTRDAYKSDITDFQAFCTRHGLQWRPASPETIARYAISLAGIVKPATIERRLSAIRFAHSEEGLPDPTAHPALERIVTGIRKKHGTPPIAKREIRQLELLRLLRAVERRPKTVEDPFEQGKLWRRAQLLTARDRALLLLGFAGAFRRSELVAINVEDVRPHPKGIQILVRRSKTDQAGKGRWKPIPRYHVQSLDPVHAYEEYRALAAITHGALFRSFDINGTLSDTRLAGGDVSRIIKRACKRAGLNPAEFASHSLRSGFVTSAAERGAAPAEIAEVSHQSLATVIHYWKKAQAFTNPPLLRIFGDNTEDAEEA